MSSHSVQPPRSRRPRWAPHRRFLRPAIPADLRSWLLDTGSLTHRVRQRCAGRFSVAVVGQGWGRPALDELRALGLRPGDGALLRHVELRCDDLPWVFARTVIPGRSLTGPQRRLARLGNRPLGAVLFAEPSMERGCLELARIPPGSGLFELATASLRDPPPVIWGRRSVFRVRHKPLLVSEIFLPVVAGGPAS